MEVASKLKAPPVQSERGDPQSKPRHPPPQFLLVRWSKGGGCIIGVQFSSVEAADILQYIDQGNGEGEEAEDDQSVEQCVHLEEEGHYIKAL